MPKLSKYFSWEEVTSSQTASRGGIDNSIPPILIEAVSYIATRMDEVREVLGSAIIVTSWYRSPALNALIKGSLNSQHMQGLAIDFISPRYGKPHQICKALLRKKNSLNWDQLILEHTWVHISFLPNIPNAKPRNQVLSLLDGGKYSNGLTDKQGNLL